MDESYLDLPNQFVLECNASDCRWKRHVTCCCWERSCKSSIAHMSWANWTKRHPTFSGARQGPWPKRSWPKRRRTIAMISSWRKLRAHAAWTWIVRKNWSHAVSSYSCRAESAKKAQSRSESSSLSAHLLQTLPTIVPRNKPKIGALSPSIAPER